MLLLGWMIIGFNPPWSGQLQFKKLLHPDSQSSSARILLGQGLLRPDSQSSSAPQVRPSPGAPSGQRNKKNLCFLFFKPGSIWACNNAHYTGHILSFAHLARYVQRDIKSPFVLQLELYNNLKTQISPTQIRNNLSRLIQGFSSQKPLYLLSNTLSFNLPVLTPTLLSPARATPPRLVR